MTEPIILTLIIWGAIEIVFLAIDKFQKISDRKRDADNESIDN